MVSESNCDYLRRCGVCLGTFRWLACFVLGAAVACISNETARSPARFVRAGLCGSELYSPFLRGRDHSRVKPSPPSSSNRFA
jgi:hypothetical protein